MSAATGDATNVWAYGKAEPGWYCAKQIWRARYAKHLEELGYRVMRSVKRPTEA